jgi:hypothetical protein
MLTRHSTTALVFRKSSPLDLPVGFALPVHQDDDGDTWAPSPRHEQAITAHRNCITNERARLGAIIWDISQYVVEGDEKPPRLDLERAVDGWHRRLLDWASALPPCVTVTDQAIPAVLDLQ